MDNNNTMEKITNLAKNRGFVYQGSEIYGGLSNSWDYGPLGVELKNNIKKLWWREFITDNPYNVGIDSSILMNPKVWEASGHLGGFSDPLMDCKNCKTRHRADDLIESQKNIQASSWDNDTLNEYVKNNNIVCPNCNESNFTDIRSFNLMFKTYLGVTDDKKNEIYLRPETAQGIFINFLNVQRTTRKKIPFGIGQIGKSFRNEITPGNFIFRTREFEQMELEFFCKPGTELEWFDFWRAYCKHFLLSLGIDETKIRFRDHEKEELSHYSNATTDIEFLFPFGWGELWGIASRTDFDLLSHSKKSDRALEYFDQETNEHYTPYCIEPSVGVDRLFLAILSNGYDEEIVDTKTNDTRVVLHLDPSLAPFKAAFLPLSKKLSKETFEIYKLFSKHFNVDFDETGSIGKRYRRQDEIGTPYCITFDFDSLEDKMVTVRDRDTMNQIRISPYELLDSFLNNIY